MFLRPSTTVLGVGLLELIPAEAIVENADPEDVNEDGIRGVAHILPNGQVGRFGWKAQIPSLTEFSRDAVSVELGLTVPAVDSLVFGTLTDDDAVDDPEISLASLEALTFYVSLLSPPAPKKDVPAGRRLFEFLECTACHIPSLPGLTGDIPAYTDLLLHTTSPADRPGVADGQAGPLQYRTPPLWGLDTGPYMHDGSAQLVRDAILAHAGEAQASRDAFDALTAEGRHHCWSFSKISIDRGGDYSFSGGEVAAAESLHRRARFLVDLPWSYVNQWQSSIIDWRCGIIDWQRGIIDWYGIIDGARHQRSEHQHP